MQFCLLVVFCCMYHDSVDNLPDCSMGGMVHICNHGLEASIVLGMSNQVSNLPFLLSAVESAGRLCSPDC